MSHSETPPPSYDEVTTNTNLYSTVSRSSQQTCPPQQSWSSANHPCYEYTSIPTGHHISGCGAARDDDKDETNIIGIPTSHIQPDEPPQNLIEIDPREIQATDISNTSPPPEYRRRSFIEIIGRPASHSDLSEKAWYRRLQFLTFVMAIFSMTLGYFKNIVTPGGPDDLLYQVYPKPAEFNHTCQYFMIDNNETTPPSSSSTSSRDLVATQLGRLSEWSIGNGVTWCIAAVALIIAYRPPNCGILSEQQRYKPWYFVVSVGSVILGLTGIGLLFQAAALWLCDLTLFMGVSILAAVNAAIGWWICCFDKN